MSAVDPVTDTASSDSAAVAEARPRGEPACTPEELQALVASDPRTAGAAIVTAPMPPRLFERSFATPSLIAHVASDKFCDGLPLHRQEDRFARLGVPIDRGTMCRWLEEAGATVGATISSSFRATGGSRAPDSIARSSIARSVGSRALSHRCRRCCRATRSTRRPHPRRSAGSVPPATLRTGVREPVTPSSCRRVYAALRALRAVVAALSEGAA